MASGHLDMTNRASVVQRVQNHQLGNMHTCQHIHTASTLLQQEARTERHILISTGLFSMIIGVLAWTPLSTEEEISANAKMEDTTVSFIVSVFMYVCRKRTRV